MSAGSLSTSVHGRAIFVSSNYVVEKNLTFSRNTEFVSFPRSSLLYMHCDEGSQIREYFGQSLRKCVEDSYPR